MTKPKIIETETAYIEITDHSVNVTAKKPYTPIEEQMKLHPYMKKYKGLLDDKTTLKKN